MVDGLEPLVVAYAALSDIGLNHLFEISIKVLREVLYVKKVYNTATTFDILLQCIP